MKASEGDWLTVKNVDLDHEPRIGQIVGVPHRDGSPPYFVRWVDTDRESLVFPGPDAHLRTAREHAAGLR